MGTGEVHPLSAGLPPADAHIALASLPYRLGLAEAGGPWWRGPYLTAGGDAAGRGKGGDLRVGLVWAGDPRHPNDARRSVAPAALEPLLDVAGVRWFGLQTGVRANETEGTRWRHRLADPSPPLADFAATATALAGLDLLITVDTAAAHLAGAMGRPAWVMLPAVDCDWRWGETGETTAWYPSLRLFRQGADGDWAGVVAALAAALREQFVEEGAHRHP